MVNNTVTRDRWGRPLIIPPEGGKPVPYIRASTVAGSLDDGQGLMAWKMRMACIGLSQRPDLLLAVAAAKENVKEINVLVEEAMEASGANNARRIGSAIHLLTETHDKGQDIGFIPPEYVADIQAYARATAEFKNLYIEQFVINDKHRIGGTPDRVVRFKNNCYIGDLKTGSLRDAEFSIQLAIYANSQPFNFGTGERFDWEEPINKKLGIIIHLPAGQGVCNLHFVDLQHGMKGVELAMNVRKWNQKKGILSPFNQEAGMNE